jgi:hypothetical protein
MMARFRHRADNLFQYKIRELNSRIFSFVALMALPTVSFTTTVEEVATVLTDEIRGKNGIKLKQCPSGMALNILPQSWITGTSLDGIGFETARIVARYANLVIITGHNAERHLLRPRTDVN